MSVQSEMTITVTFNLDDKQFVVEDTSTYTDPVADLVGILKSITDPNGNTVYTNVDFGSPDIDMDVLRTYTDDLNLDLDGNVIEGAYVFTYAVKNNNTLEEGEIANDYYFDHTTPTAQIDLDLDVLLSTITSTDDTNYGDDFTSTVRTHTLTPPGANPTETVSADASFLVTPITTGIWQSSLSSVATYTYAASGVYLELLVIETITAYDSIPVVWDTDLGNIYKCVNTMRLKVEELKACGDKSVYELENKYFHVIGRMEIYKRALIDGNSTMSNALYQEIVDVAGCADCLTDDTAPITVIPINQVAGPAGPAGAAGPAGPAGDDATVVIVDSAPWTVITEAPTGTFTFTGNALVANTVFVDGEKGNDNTGVIERMDLPFWSLAAAEAAVLVNGMTIHVRPDTYGSVENLGSFADAAVTDLAYYLEEGVVLDHTGICFDTSGLTTLKISGQGKTTGVGHDVVYSNNNCTVHAEFNENTGCKFGLFNGASSAGDKYFKSNYVEGRGSQQVDGSADCFTDVKRFKHSGATVEGAVVKGTWTGTFAQFDIPLGTIADNSADTLLKVGEGGASTGQVDYTGRMVDTRVTASAGVVEQTSCKLKLRGDIKSTAAVCISTMASSTGELDYDGYAYSVDGTAIELSGTSPKVTIRGKCATDTEDKGVITVLTAGVTTKLKGMIVNRHATGIGVAINATGHATFDNATIVSNSYGISTTLGAVDYRVANGLAMTTADNPICTNLMPTANVVISTEIVE